MDNNLLISLFFSGEKPYQCYQCENKGFTTSHSLKNHLNRHEVKNVSFSTSSLTVQGLA